MKIEEKGFQTLTTSRAHQFDIAPWTDESVRMAFQTEKLQIFYTQELDI